MIIQVIEFHTPDELAKLVDFQLQDEGIPDDATVSEICKTVLNYSVHTRKCMAMHYFSVNRVSSRNFILGVKC